ncbi:MAG: carboxymuconolactone decarboxylase family protein [Chloroflexi bacterium]|nr:carboxymuconolactone decarboxylase family protein [Chloroflexota bacterium]
MSRPEIYREIEQTLGLVPEFFQSLPDTTLGHEWELMKRFQFSEDTSIPIKYKQLIGVAVSAALRCPYCTLFHTEAARLMGATSAEIEECVALAKDTSGWSAYLNGLRFDLERFRSELGRIIEYVKGVMLKKAA